MLSLIIEIIIIFIVSLGLSFFLPVFPSNYNVLDFTAIPLVVIYSLITSFFINSARAKRAKLKSNISAELSRVRRVYHLVKEMHLKHSQWSQKLSQNIKEYLEKFQTLDFKDYEQTRTEFRKITKSIYSFKNLDSPYTISIYQELLNTLRDWALLRQNISSGLKEKIVSQWWVIIFFSALTTVVSLIFIRVDNIVSKLIVSFSVAVIFLVFLLLYQIDNINKRERKKISQKYVKNIDYLEI